MEAGFNADSIQHLTQLIGEMQQKDFQGMVVLKDNQIVIEEYFNTSWRITINDIRSAGKGITTLLLGIAMKEGLIESLEQSVYSLFREDLNPIVNQDYRRIKLKDVLDVASGLDADTDDTMTAGHAI